ncbi:MAG TPA: hypothetical protein DCM67_08185 [Propionibacteriaceae bacterium]|nr:hypothetical protein [Propionibacteriaceae bacterium]
MRIAGSLWSVPVADHVQALSAAIDDGLSVVHWDSSDGIFAAAGGFTPEAAASLLRQVPSVESEAHLMMHDPLPVIPAWAQFCRSITIPVEIEAAFRAVDLIATLGVQPCLAISPQTDLTRLPDNIPVLLMSVQPGQAGSAFRPSTIDRVFQLHELDPTRLLGVDGGISPAHCVDLARVGAGWIVSGTSLFTAPSLREWLSQCRQAGQVANAPQANSEAD